MKRLLLPLLTGTLALASSAQVINESFETWPPEGWTTNPSEGTKTWLQSEENCAGSFGPGNAFDGTYAASLNMMQVVMNTPTELITPRFDLSGMKNPQLSFEHAYVNRMTADVVTLDVYAGRLVDGDVQFSLIAKAQVPEGDNLWHNFSQVLGRDVVQIKLSSAKTVGATFKPIYVDAFKITEGQEVAPPVNIKYEPIVGVDGSMKLMWEVPNGESRFRVKVSSEEINPETDNAEFTTQVNGTPECIIDGLTPGVVYNCYVQTVDGAKQSAWATTQMRVNYAPVELPVSFDFNDDNGGFLFVQDEQPNKWYRGTAPEPADGNCLFISKDGETYEYEFLDTKASMYRDFKMPDEMDDGVVLTFDFKCGGSYPNHNLRVFVTDNLSEYPRTDRFYTGNRLGDYLYDVAEWTNVTREIPPSYAGKVVRIIFEWACNKWSGNNPGAAIDNLRLVKAGALTPKNLTLSEPTKSSITVAWEEQGSSTEWEIQYMPYKGDEAEAVTVKVESEPKYVVADLKDCHHYSFRVRSLNNEKESEWTKWATLATLSEDKTAPYFNNFDDLDSEYLYNVSNLYPAGWSSSASVAMSTPLLMKTDMAHSAPNAMSLSAMTDADELTLVTPPFSDLAARDKRITFYANINPEQSLTIGVMSDPTDGSTFVPVKTYYGMDYLVDNGKSVISENHRFILPLTSEEIKPEHKYIAFCAGKAFQTWTVIDDFSYELMPEILEPINVRLLDCADERARVTWDSVGDETKWEVAWGQTEFDVVEDDVPRTENVDEPMIVMDLDELSTFYKVYVRPVMADGTKGGWSESCPFPAYPITVSLPYMENFDGGATYGNVPVYGRVLNGWQVVDYRSKWQLAASEEASSGRNCILYPELEEDFNDWMFTPSLRMEKGKNYLVSVRGKVIGAEGCSLSCRRNRCNRVEDVNQDKRECRTDRQISGGQRHFQPDSDR